MKFLRERKEIAKAINIDHIPVITMDISNPMDGYPDCYEGSRLNIAYAYKSDRTLYCEVTARMYGDEFGNECHDAPWFYKRIHLSTHCICLQDSFSVRDVDKMVEWSNARVVKPEDKVIVYFRAENEAYLRLMKVGKRIDPFCQTATMLEDIE